MKTRILISLFLSFGMSVMVRAACNETLKIKRDAGVSKTFVESDAATCFSSGSKTITVTWMSHNHNAPISWTLTFTNNSSPCVDPNDPNQNKQTFSNAAGDNACTITAKSFARASASCVDGDYDKKPTCFKYAVDALYPAGVHHPNDPQVIVDSTMGTTGHPARKKK